MQREKFIRKIGAHYRTKAGRRQAVSEYYQRYDKPRGKKGQLGYSAREQPTMWLKDEQGRFVGRADKKGKTKAQKVAMGDFDSTKTWRERGKYGRVYGRTSSGA